MPQGKLISLDNFIAAFRSGEERGYDHFFRLYFRPLSFFAGKLLKTTGDAEDIVQDCFTRLWERRESLGTPESIRAYLYTTVRNACISHLRSKKGVVMDVIILEEVLADETAADDEAAAIQAEMLRLLYDSIETLPERIKQVFKLYYLEGRKDSDISNALHTSPHTIRNQRTRALELLRERLKLSE